MRIAMGLKPLQVEGGGAEAREAKERAAGKAREEERRKKTEAAELRERIETYVFLASLQFLLLLRVTQEHMTALRYIVSGFRYCQAALV